MFPILWRYTLQGYLRVFFLSVFCFLSILIVSRFKIIARFAALSSDWGKTARFVLYQLPMILPMAIPISALIASLLLFQRLSQSSELTALRASGLSLKSLVTPLLLASCFLCLANFSFNAEIAPFCRRESQTLLYRETTENPLLLLQRQQLIKIKHAYLKMKPKAEGKAAKDFLLIAYNQSNQRLSLITAKQLWLDGPERGPENGQELWGSDVALISHLSNENPHQFDPLILENQALMSTEAPLLSLALKKNRPRLEANALNLRMLQIRAQLPTRQGRSAQVEIFRRFSVSLGAFSLTLLGCAFGITAGRNPSKKNFFVAASLTLLLLLSYFLGKEFKANPYIALAAFLTPHVLIAMASLRQLHKIARGAG
jgi:lipopolysaccharide export system permease protein